MAIEIKENVPLASLTTFGIGGGAKYLTEVKTDVELREAIIWARDRITSFHILSGGSNVLIPDEGLRGLVIRIVSDSYVFNGLNLIADAGCNLTMLIREAGRRGLGGWESLAGIPGSIGGAIRGNAGAFGSELKDYTFAVRAYNHETGELRTFVNEACHFAYRSSYFKQHFEWIILNVEVALREIGPQESAEGHHAA
ncbi:MAG: UDP-N-acetylenolpyruvoylglucosamine reductase [Parcubacteria group bacterium GW2011_GWA2_51_10]|nr:MAG: UDP-N-acetylenolpyruvoylglucosamine reductase [Parcubacteria group bacterium GW2011_GWA2_51_10]